MFYCHWDFPGGSVVKNPLAKAGNTSLISATHSSILAWEIPRTEEPGRLQSIGLQRARHDWAGTHTYTHLHARCWLLALSGMSQNNPMR